MAAPIAAHGAFVNVIPNFSSLATFPAAFLAERADMRMSRAIAATVCGLALDGCSALNSNLLNLNVPNIDLFDPPLTATLTIESNPPGAEARPSSGGLCRTQSALLVPLNEGFTVTYTLEGYLPVSVRSIRPKKARSST
jgi:hypothetical protein